MKTRQAAAALADAGAPGGRSGEEYLMWSAARCQSYILVVLALASTLYIWFYIHADSFHRASATAGATALLGERAEETMEPDTGGSFAGR